LNTERSLSRRDFLRFRRTEQGAVLEVSCRALFMRCADAGIATEPADDWEPWMGEPPAVFHRRSVPEIVESFERDLASVRVLRLQEPEWLDSISDRAGILAAIDAFRSRGGIVERVDRT
jgi:hypothetical protein